MRHRTLTLLLLAVSACTPTQYRMDPYRHDSAAASALSKRAYNWCAAKRGERDLPPHPFTSDGCTLSPDGDWAECCVDHDIAYWCGGSKVDRRNADRGLADCIIAKGHPASQGRFTRLAVKVGGPPWMPFPWRWGYGWEAPRGYETAP